MRPDVQKKLATKVQSVFLNNLPIIPLFVGPRWSTYSTRYFHGFNSAKNFYGDPVFTTFPDNVLSFTRIAPGATTTP
jgi:peptide/nickel transport system substrate-binding protein